jgi:nuclear pore complex protein Nup160
VNSGVQVDTIAKDETEFSKKYLASSASIYCRKHQKGPRNFLWRILDDESTLSIQSIDISREAQEVEAPYTLHLVFPDAIKPSGVVFADSEEHEPLTVFALTKKTNDLYTITLRPEFFVNPTATEGNTRDWCHTFQPAAFIYRYPHRLAALGPADLLVSLHDGGLLRLVKKPTDDGAHRLCSF